MATLKDVLPHEFMGGEYDNTPAMRFKDVEVVATFHPDRGDARWPGPQKNVCVWYALANGKAVGWNENVSKGWSFPVIRYTNS